MRQRSFFQIRWGFVFALVVIVGISALAIILYSVKWLLTTEEYGLAFPSRAYAEEVAFKLTKDIGDRFSPLSPLYLWRSTGRMDSPTQFSKGALFWFVYNSAENNFTLNLIDSVRMNSVQERKKWEQKLAAVTSPVLATKKTGFINESLTDSTDECYLDAKIYEDEPRLVGLVTDLQVFRKIDVPELVEQARVQYPLLDGFTLAPKGGQNNLAVIIKDDRGDIIAQLGDPGSSYDGKNIKFPGFVKSYPFGPSGFRLDVIIPRSFENIWWWYIKRGFIAMVAIWVLTLIFWVWAEVRLTKVDIGLGKVVQTKGFEHIPTVKLGGSVGRGHPTPQSH